MRAVARPCSVANLDPANENIPYDAKFDVRELVNIDEVMEREHLGPNGGVLWAMEEVEANLDWLEDQLDDCGESLSMQSVKNYSLNRRMHIILTRCRRDYPTRSTWTARVDNTSHGLTSNSPTAGKTGLSCALKHASTLSSITPTN